MQLAQTGKEVNDLEDTREVMMFLRHEAGHAFNYAYRLHALQNGKNCSARFVSRNHDEYHPVPFSKNFVRHMAGWYAQKHPIRLRGNFRGLADAALGMENKIPWLGSDAQAALYGSHRPKVG